MQETLQSISIKILKRLALLCVLFSSSCGEFNVSPYVSNTKNYNTNSSELSKISSTEAGAPTNYKIAVISDTHNYYEQLKSQVDYINKRKNEYEFVIVAGDITNLGLLREFETTRDFLEDLEIPYIVAAGNHDLLSNGESIYDQMFGSSNFSFTFKQTKYIVYNNNNWEASGKSPDLDFLEAELASSTSTNIVLVSHVSPEDKARWTTEEIDALKNLVTTYSVNYYLNGHDHNPGCGSFATSTRCTIGASNKGKILEINLTNSGVSHQYIRF